MSDFYFYFFPPKTIKSIKRSKFPDNGADSWCGKLGFGDACVGHGEDGELEIRVLEMLFAMADEIESSHEQRELASPAPASSQRDPGDKDRGWLRVHNVGGSLTFLLQVFPFPPLFFQTQIIRLPFVMCFFKVACFFFGAFFFPPRLFSCLFSFCVCVLVFFLGLQFVHF